MKPNVMSATLAAAVATVSGGATAGEYLSGDFHNHTTCSDGSTNVEVLTEKSLTYLDWFIHVGHSGDGERDCRVSDFLYLNRDGGLNGGLWSNTVGGGPKYIPAEDGDGNIVEGSLVLNPDFPSDAFKGDFNDSSLRDGNVVQEMWRWQSLQEYNLEPIVTARELPMNTTKEAFLGLEWVVPGHEHSSNSIATGQYLDSPNADAIAQFEYCFARNSDDTSQGGGQGWTCELSEEGNNALIALFEGRPEEGTADYNSTLEGGININDAGEHVKSTAGVLWMQENFPGASFSVGAHVERQGAFIEDDDEGYNVEHFRDWHTVAPDVAFGFESEPGHQAAYDRGTYNAGRPSSGLYTFNGAGCYAGAEAARPGFDFDGVPLTQEDFQDGGRFPDVGDDQDPAKVTVCRPGVRTMWDAMLSEGRRFWYFASSDWHNRGNFGPLDFESTLDFWPGEHQEIFTYIEDYSDDPAQAIVDSLRSGNSYSVQGQLIGGDGFSFEACAGGDCATMGETLTVSSGQKVRVRLVAEDPGSVSNAPYDFYNPALTQIGVLENINRPSVRSVDFIAGEVGGQFTPMDPEYFEPLAPETTRVVASFSYSHGNNPAEARGLERSQTIRAQWSFRATADSYVRARGSNIPPGTPSVNDADGNPLPDNLKDNIVCDSPACPPHVDGILTADLEAWSVLMFHTNPIFIEVED